jgi:tRNA (mo5U34)-methyltransferase
MLERSWFSDLSPNADQALLSQTLAQAAQRLSDPRWNAHRAMLEDLSSVRADRVSCDQAQVTFERDSPLTASEEQRLASALHFLKPWKKGPFRLFGHSIDAEWRSDLKWDRLAGSVGSLEGQVVADIGCHNGYFMYRMLAHGARRVLGFEPFAQHSLTFSLFQQLYLFEQLHLELLGVEHMDLFPETFDTIFCLGILYHHTDPIGLLRKMRLALRSKGRLFIDCQGIPGDEAISLTPKGRYAGASGIWFLPTEKALETWALRAGFSRIEKIYSAPLSCEEQRATPWAEIKSLADFLDPDQPHKTIEGYPAPWRHYLMLRS